MARRKGMSKKETVQGKELKKVGKGGLKYKAGRILCIILHEGKGSTWYWLDESQERFSVNDNTYFKQDAGTYVKDAVRFCIYLEGISLPIHHGYIDRETVTTTFKDKDTGEDKTVEINRIKGLKFDSKIIDILLNRHLADVFTKQYMDLPNLVIIILLVLNVILGFGGLVAQFFVK